MAQDKEEKKPLSASEKVKLAKKGEAAGALIAGTGGLGFAAGHALQKLAPKARERALNEALPKGYRNLNAWIVNNPKTAEKAMKGGKTTGAIMAGVGAGVGVVSAYQHYKNKKKAKEEKKDEGKKDK